MKREDFIEVNNDEYIKCINKIIESNGKCHPDIIKYGCDSCPFDESNNPEGIHCVDSGLTNVKIDTRESDDLMLNSAMKFRDLYYNLNVDVANKNELSTKLYKLDFKDLINNATNRAYWAKKWEIFNYDGMSVEFFLDSINITNNKLNGKIKLNGGDDWRTPETRITIPLQEDNFNKEALERELVGRVDSIFLEQGCIDLRKTREYKNIEDLEDELKDRLRDIAREFLNSNNIYNDDIRDLYIDDYISNNEKDYTSNYIDEKKYSTYVSHRATFAYIMGFNDKAERIIEDSGEIDLEYILEQAEELKLQLENEDFEEYEASLEDL